MCTLNRIGGAALCLTLALALIASPRAWAADRDPASFVWIISDTGFGSQDSTLAMSRGAAWPVVFGEFETITLRPVENTFTNTFWHDIAPGLGSGLLRASSSSNGSVAGVSDNSNFPGLQISPTGGITFLASDVIAVDHSTGGALVTATDSTVTGFPYDAGSRIDDIAVSPFGEGGVLRGYEFFDSVTGDSVYLPNFGGQPSDDGSLTYDALGRPHVVFANGAVYDFDTIAGTWTAGWIGSTANNSAIPIAADSTGVVGAAYVDSSTFDLIYAYWSASAGWNTTTVDTFVDPHYQIGLDFDYDDLPVISYVKGNSLYVAYDPIVAVPEPTAVMLLSGLGLLMLQRRGSRE